MQIFDLLYDDDVCSLVYMQDQTPKFNFQKKAFKRKSKEIQQNLTKRVQLPIKDAVF